MVSAPTAPVERPRPAVPEDPRYALLRACAAGDQAALAQFYDSTSRIVFGLLRRILGEEGAAEEVLLDVYLQVWQRARTYDPGRSAPLTWLLTLARSRAIDHLRARMRRGSWQPLDEVADFPHPGPGPEEESALSRRRTEVRRALASLPAEQRTVLELAYFCGLSQSEIAAHTGLPLGTVKTRVRLGMSRLRDALVHFAEEV